MRSVSISVTEAARNFADCINRVRYQGISFILHRNGVAVARIIPAGRAAGESELAEKSAETESAPDGTKPGQARKPAAAEIW